MCLQALRCTWQLIEGNHTCQQRLLDADIPSSSGTSNSALQVDTVLSLCSGITWYLKFKSCDVLS